MLMSPKKGETAVMAAMGDTAVRVHEVLAKPWVGVPLAFSLSQENFRHFSTTPLVSARNDV